MQELRAKIEELQKEVKKLNKKVDLIDQNPFEKDVWTLEDLSFITGKSQSYFYKLTSKKEIPHYKKGATLFFDKEEILNWIKTDKVC